MTDIDHAADSCMRVSGGTHEPEIVRALSLERLQEISAETHAWELVEALKAAVAGAPHWRHEAQLLLRAIAAGSIPEPPR